MNILLLTNQYPHKDDKTLDRTKVVADFARAWVRAGHNVKVIVNTSFFPRFFYTVATLFCPKVYSSAKKSEAPHKMWDKLFDLDDQGAQVINIPMRKFIPHGKFSNIICKKQIKTITEQLKKHNFVPDVVTGHWVNPQLFLIPELAQKYHARSAIVFHGDYIEKTCKKFSVQKRINKIDKIGFRSNSAKKQARGYLTHKSEAFVAASGIPKEYILTDNCRNENRFSNSYTKIVCVARLLSYKKIDKVILGAIHSFEHNEFELNIVGSGPLNEELFSLIQKENVVQDVHLLGEKPRTQLQETIAQSDVFALISENETFGLVYLEAMAKGCIVIASRFGGVDGIIIDGENGFLCEEGNDQMLTDIFKHIAQMTYEEKMLMSQKAIETAKEYTEDKVAQRYLDNVMS